MLWSKTWISFLYRVINYSPVKVDSFTKMNGLNDKFKANVIMRDFL